MSSGGQQGTAESPRRFATGGGVIQSHSSSTVYSFGTGGDGRANRAGVSYLMFGKSKNQSQSDLYDQHQQEADRQLKVTAEQQAETERQLKLTEQQQAETQRQLESAAKMQELMLKNIQRQSRVLDRQEQLLDRLAEFLDRVDGKGGT